jgi:hypothetical protein
VDAFPIETLTPENLALDRRGAIRFRTVGRASLFSEDGPVPVSFDRLPNPSLVAATIRDAIAARDRETRFGA